MQPTVKPPPPAHPQIASVHSFVEPEHEFTVAWRNIEFSVERKTLTGRSLGIKQILKGVNGRAAPREVVAIMGPSGSGKTTLLDVVGDRLKSGRITGDILVNGAPRVEKTFRAVTNYVAQEDHLLGSFTVLETLRYAAAIALPPKVAVKEREERCQSAIDEMGLRVCANTRVGDVFVKGISGGQKRRLSIAIELIAKPAIMVLDEPTSGLDSSSTFNIMKYICQISQHGRAIVCTIHQPSSAVFNMFASVMLLVAGEEVYFGPPGGALGYFSGLGYPCPQYENPADFFLSLINTDFEGHGDVPSIVASYKESSQLRVLKEAIEADTVRGGIDPGIASKLAPSSFRQFKTLMHRNLLDNARNPGIFWVRLFMYFCLAFMVGTMYLRTNKDLVSDDYVPLLFYVQAFLVFMSVAVLPFFIEQRGVFGRERANSSLSIPSYVVANLLSVLPGIFLIAILSSILVVFLADLNAFGWFLLNLFLSLVVAESMMHVIGSAVPHYIIGIALGAGIFGMFMLCEGFMVPKDNIPGYGRQHARTREPCVPAAGPARLHVATGRRSRTRCCHPL
eukprot:jgi/Mesvir1/10521/Mv21764-RA.2